MITETDKKNGWTEEALAKYQKEREKANLESISSPRVIKPQQQTSYRPHRWRDG